MIEIYFVVLTGCDVAKPSKEVRLTVCLIKYYARETVLEGGMEV
jgi:hypothetical protein